MSLPNKGTPCDRDHRDVDVITHRLRRVEQLARLPSTVLQQLAYCGYYEDLERGVTLFRQGDLGSSWYAVLGGTLDVRCHDPKDLDEKSVGNAPSTHGWDSNPDIPVTVNLLQQENEVLDHATTDAGISLQ
uniref:Cyclic nucleotide-binding domain-containing protein n=1 Tax=Timema shepardi TaxID=629360 RepID=A0A7R9AMA6_TIMSH|nr:unnamed protein product [Timema shepardi]